MQSRDIIWLDITMQPMDTIGDVSISISLEIRFIDFFKIVGEIKKHEKAIESFKTKFKF